MLRSAAYADRLVFRVAILNTDLESANLGQATGMPKEPEVIKFADDQSEQRAKKLVLRGGPFDGSTKLRCGRMRPR